MKSTFVSMCFARSVTSCYALIMNAMLSLTYTCGGEAASLVVDLMDWAAAGSPAYRNLPMSSIEHTYDYSLDIATAAIPKGFTDSPMYGDIATTRLMSLCAINDILSAINAPNECATTW